MFNDNFYFVLFHLGPFCGSESLESSKIETLQSEITLVFYSDPNNGWRSDGILRALITADQRGMVKH